MNAHESRIEVGWTDMADEIGSRSVTSTLDWSDGRVGSKASVGKGALAKIGAKGTIFWAQFVLVLCDAGS